MMQERSGLITIRGNPLTLLGNEVKTGEVAPEFVSLDNDLTPIKFSSYRNRLCIISSVPSLDTPICDIETRKFNEEASKLGDKIQILTISMDLPFAQKRWCGAAGVNKIQTLSDHREAQFGTAYGVLIKELRLLARAVFIVDQKGRIQYIQLVKEITNEPNYEEIWSALKKIK
jgi:thiol peroxidase